MTRAGTPIAMAPSGTSVATTELAATMAPAFVFVVLFARHAKAFYLAFDHFVDPPVPDFDDDPGGDRSIAPRPPAPASRVPSDVIEPR